MTQYLFSLSLKYSAPFQGQISCGLHQIQNNGLQASKASMDP